MIKKILEENLNKTIGVYIFNENNFIVGDVFKISNNYLILKSYDIKGLKNGIKFILLKMIKRIIIKSDYIEELKKPKKQIKLPQKMTTDIFLEYIIRNKILLFVNFIDGSNINCYLTKKIEEIYYFNVLNDEEKTISEEIISEEYIKMIAISKKIVKKNNFKKKETIIKIRLHTNEVYFGNIIKKEEKNIIIWLKEEFEDTETCALIKLEEIEEITEIPYKENFDVIGDDVLDEILSKNTIFEVLKICKEARIVVYIDNENYRETKVGILNEISRGVINLKLLNENIQFTEIIRINIKDIQILYIKNTG